jgi:hypothetical protein
VVDPVTAQERLRKEHSVPPSPPSTAMLAVPSASRTSMCRTSVAASVVTWWQVSVPASPYAPATDGPPAFAAEVFAQPAEEALAVTSRRVSV